MSYTCPICGNEFPDRMKLGSHMWTAHKTKMKAYEATNGPITANLSESTIPCNDGLMQPSMVKESREFVTETTKPVNDGFIQPAPVVDRDIITPTVQTETVKPANNILNEQRSEQIRSQIKIDRPANPYREMYGNDGGEVWNEFLGR